MLRGLTPARQPCLRLDTCNANSEGRAGGAAWHGRSRATCFLHGTALVVTAPVPALQSLQCSPGFQPDHHQGAALQRPGGVSRRLSHPAWRLKLQAKGRAEAEGQPAWAATRCIVFVHRQPVPCRQGPAAGTGSMPIACTVHLLTCRHPALMQARQAHMPGTAIRAGGQPAAAQAMAAPSTLCKEKRSTSVCPRSSLGGSCSRFILHCILPHPFYHHACLKPPHC